MGTIDVAIARSINPATGEDVAAYPYLNEDGVASALAQAAEGFGTWRDTAPPARVDVFRRLSALLRRDVERLASVVTTEMGKPVTQAQAEVRKVADMLDWYADKGPDMLEDQPTSIGPGAYVSYLPTGTILAVMPWNFPVWQVFRGAAPIILGGNGYLLKPASNVVGCAYAIQELWEEAGLPVGTFHVVNAERELIPSIIHDPRITGVAVTGGTAAGQSVAAEAGRAIKKVILELGGSDPFIVLADADIDKAVAAAATGRMLNAGQVCISAKRIIVERPIAEEFTSKLTERIRSLKVGDPTDPQTEVGPMSREEALLEVDEQVRRTVSEGARLLAGGYRLDGPGSFYAPTVLADVTDTMTAFREEIFGPVATIIVAEDAEDALAKANNSEFGLSAAIWTADNIKARAMARRIDAGGVFINAPSVSDPRIPIGGVKKSGFGRELSYLGVHEFTNIQAVWDKTPSIDSDTDLFERGLATRRGVLGDAYVQKSLDGADAFSMPMQELVTKYCWGDVWNRPGLERAQRSLINLAMISALNRPHELKVHVRGAVRNGVTKDQIQEVFLQVAIYCGAPAALESFRLAREVFNEMVAEA